MSLIDKTYFHSEINIAQVQSIPVQAAIALMISKYEAEYLEKVLGYAFWKLFNAAIAETSGRWYDLKVGAEYKNAYGHTKKWDGFINTEKLSPIANYCYYWYMRENVTFSGGAGEMEGKGENSTVVSPGPKMARAWNEAVDQAKILHDFLLNKKDGDGELVYPEFTTEEIDSDIVEKVNIMNI